MGRSVRGGNVVGYRPVTPENAVVQRDDQIVIDRNGEIVVNERV
jgi:hypothetical protein